MCPTLTFLWFAGLKDRLTASLLEGKAQALRQRVQDSILDVIFPAEVCFELQLGWNQIRRITRLRPSYLMVTFGGKNICPRAVEPPSAPIKERKVHWSNLDFESIV